MFRNLFSSELLKSIRKFIESKFKTLVKDGFFGEATLPENFQNQEALSHAIDEMDNHYKEKKYDLSYAALDTAKEIIEKLFLPIDAETSARIGKRCNNLCVKFYNSKQYDKAYDCCKIAIQHDTEHTHEIMEKNFPTIIYEYYAQPKKISLNSIIEDLNAIGILLKNAERFEHAHNLQSENKWLVYWAKLQMIKLDMMRTKTGTYHGQINILEKNKQLQSLWQEHKISPRKLQVVSSQTPNTPITAKPINFQLELLQKIKEHQAKNTKNESSVSQNELLAQQTPTPPRPKREKPTDLLETSIKIVEKSLANGKHAEAYDRLKNVIAAREEQQLPIDSKLATSIKTVCRALYDNFIKDEQAIQEAYTCIKYAVMFDLTDKINLTTFSQTAELLHKNDNDKLADIINDGNEIITALKYVYPLAKNSKTLADNIVSQSATIRLCIYNLIKNQSGYASTCKRMLENKDLQELWKLLDLTPEKLKNTSQQNTEENNPNLSTQANNSLPPTENGDSNSDDEEVPAPPSSTDITTKNSDDASDDSSNEEESDDSDDEAPPPPPELDPERGITPKKLANTEETSSSSNMGKTPKTPQTPTTPNNPAMMLEFKEKAAESLERRRKIFEKETNPSSSTFFQETPKGNTPKQPVTVTKPESKDTSEQPVSTESEQPASATKPKIKPNRPAPTTKPTRLAKTPATPTTPKNGVTPNTTVTPPESNENTTTSNTI